MAASTSEGSGRPIRFLEPRRAVAPITELTRRPRLFEQRGLVTRRAHAQSPPRVEYEATPLAMTLRQTLDSLAVWMTTHGPGLRA